MEPLDLLDGLVLAAMALDGARAPRTLALAEPLALGLRERLDALSAAADRRSAVASIVERARPAFPATLPSNPRAAALLAPQAPRGVREAAGPLRQPRRGFRPPPGLAAQLQRVTTAPDRSARAQAEQAWAEACPWPA